MDELDREIDELKAEIVVLQSQTAVNTPSQPSPNVEADLASGYGVEQVTALVGEVIRAAGRAQNLETALAEAHDALAEACELEGHLLDMQAVRDDLAQQLQTLGQDYDHLAGELDSKKEEITLLQDAVNAAESNASVFGRQRDAAKDELEEGKADFEDERQRLMGRMNDLQDRIAHLEDEQANSQQHADEPIQQLTTTLRETEMALDELREANEQLNSDIVRLEEDADGAATIRQRSANQEVQLANALRAKELAEQELARSASALNSEIEHLTAQRNQLEADLANVSESLKQEASMALARVQEQCAAEVAVARAEKDQVTRAVSDLDMALQRATTEYESLHTHSQEEQINAQAQFEELASDYRQLQTDLTNARGDLASREEILQAVQAELCTRTEDVKRVANINHLLEVDLKKRLVFRVP